MGVSVSAPSLHREYKSTNSLIYFWGTDWRLSTLEAIKLQPGVHVREANHQGYGTVRAC